MIKLWLFENNSNPYKTLINPYKNKNTRFINIFFIWSKIIVNTYKTLINAYTKIQHYFSTFFGFQLFQIFCIFLFSTCFRFSHIFDFFRCEIFQIFYICSVLGYFFGFDIFSDVRVFVFSFFLHMLNFENIFDFDPIFVTHFRDSHPTSHNFEYIIVRL